MLPEKPRILDFFGSREWEQLLEWATASLFHCQLCPWECGVDRRKQTGVCGQGVGAKFTNAVVHRGEEPPLIEGAGAGTVFFSGCNMKCVYCQNFGFSQLGNGKDVPPEQLADAFLKLQEKGVCNLDLVTPTPHLPAILQALSLAIPRGFHLPIVWNTSSYESLEVLKRLEPVVDLYLADIRYTDDALGKRYSGVPDYWTRARIAIREMFRQRGSRGLIIRHLVMPGGISGTASALSFVAEELSTSVPVSLMSQYFPTFRAREFAQINRRITPEEYQQAVQLLEDNLLWNGWVQELEKR
ncbi:MAG TPA: radical SAM protein [Thermotogota bacterium]|nr:radical SAM protein [Thermotogota bacterium]